uniref:Uncharacterized protein n=1 Tax=Panagrolaimus sp. ES5 TaxID=591445 RepID=A0AC34FDV6_9BILA
MKEYLQALLNEDIYYDEANPKYRCFLNLYHVAKATKLIAILHTAILFGSNLDSLILKILLFFSVKVTIFTILALIWWQADIIYKCRKYFEDKIDQHNYMHLSVPESFIDTKISETLPITVGPKVPEYVFYSLEEEIENEEKSDTEEKEKKIDATNININLNKE